MKAVGANGSAAVVALALAVSGCGSSSLSAGDLRSRASGICTGAARQTNAIAAPKAPSATAAFLAAGVGPLQAEASALAALRPPGDLARAFQSAVKAKRDEVNALRRAARALRHGDDPTITVKSLQQQLDPLERTQDAAWQALQIPSCLTR